MKWTPAARLRVYALLVVTAAAVTLISRRPEAAVLATPLALLIAFDVATREPPDVRLLLDLSEAKVSEGDTVVLTVTLTAGPRRGWVEVVVPLPSELRTDADAGAGPWRFRLRPQVRQEVRIDLSVERWGRYEIGPAHIRLTSVLGMFVAEGQQATSMELVAYPRPENLRRLVPALNTQAAVGMQLARTKGAGTEFAGVRPFTSGDRPREVNWRVAARHGGLWVNERHPDRSTDVVLFLDGFGGPTLTAAVRAADSLARAYLTRRDRVGLVSFGGVMRWIRLGMGTRQTYVIIDALIGTGVFQSEAWKDIAVIPPHFLPAQALVVAVSPLEDDRIAAAMIDLRDRGVDLAVVEVSPEPYAPAPADDAQWLARRLWRMQRDKVRDGYRARGIPVAEWSDTGPLTGAVEELGLWPRRQTGARA